jgi:hypothetical protein
MDEHWIYLSDEQKHGLDNWRSHVVGVLATGRPCASEIMFWLNAMGFRYDGDLSVPASLYAGASIWTGIEKFWTDSHWYFEKGIAPYGHLRTSPRPDQSGLANLIRAYPPQATTVFEMITTLYGRVVQSLGEDYTYLKENVPGFSPEIIVSGLLVLFQFFLVFSTDAIFDYGYLRFYVLPNVNCGWGWYCGTVGPYTVSIYYCENGVVRGIKNDIELLTYASQSIDAELLLQDETQASLAATTVIGGPVKSELDSDVVLLGRVQPPLESSVSLMGLSATNAPAYIGLQTPVQSEVPADGLLAGNHPNDVPASERLILDYWCTLDADVCVHNKVPTVMACSVVLIPDSSDEIKTELERLHIQKIRIFGQPIPYSVYDSRKDTEVVP